MANIAARALEIASGGQFPAGTYGYKWPAVTNADTPTLIEVMGFERMVFMAVGTWGGATVLLKGTLNPSMSAADHIQLQDWNGNNISFTADGIKAVQQAPLVSVLPTHSGGGGTESLDLYLLLFTTARR